MSCQLQDNSILLCYYFFTASAAPQISAGAWQDAALCGKALLIQNKYLYEAFHYRGELVSQQESNVQHSISSKQFGCQGHK